MANQINQQSKDQKASISLILGSINFGVIIAIELLRRVSPAMVLGPIINFIFFQVNPFIAIIGLILGILSLKSRKNNSAMVGVILNLVGILFPIFFFLFY